MARPTRKLITEAILFYLSHTIVKDNTTKLEFNDDRNTYEQKGIAVPSRAA